MSNSPQVNGLHSIDLVVADIAKTAAFYEETWGLTSVSSDAEAHPIWCGCWKVLRQQSVRSILRRQMAVY
jgi:catechol-2,3-dioxygenase